MYLCSITGLYFNDHFIYISPASHPHTSWNLRMFGIFTFSTQQNDYWLINQMTDKWWQQPPVCLHFGRGHSAVREAAPNTLGVNATCGSIISSESTLFMPLDILLLFHPAGPVDQLNLAHWWYSEVMRDFFFSFTTFKRERNPGD